MYFSVLTYLLVLGNLFYYCHLVTDGMIDSFYVNYEQFV